MIARASQCVVTILLGCVSLPRAAALTYEEILDAGPLPDLAQEVAGFDSIEAILGRLDHAFDVDLYRIEVGVPQEFAAAALPTHDAAPDLQLFLFDAWGRGVLSNDDWGVSRMPLIPGGALTGYPPSEYLLGVSPADNDPVGVFGELFPDVESEASAPYANSRSDRLIGWTRDFTAVGGDYLIALSGVQGIATPLAADFDEDGDVDAFDRAIWEEGFASSSTHLAGDAAS
ncbi:MAG: hypothetical protein KDA61_14980, partial [Planctomycetales bacterium]|nr:hypothetical protein [Planctomycetales bacterium]